MAVNFSPSGLGFFVMNIIFVLICGILIALRFVAMRISRRSLYLDDGFILFAYVSCTNPGSRVRMEDIDWHSLTLESTQANGIALAGVGIWSSVNGLGKSESVLTNYEVAAAAKVCNAFTNCCCCHSQSLTNSITATFHSLYMLATCQCLLQTGNPCALQSHIHHKTVQAVVLRCFGSRHGLRHQLFRCLYDRL